MSQDDNRPSARMVPGQFRRRGGLHVAGPRFGKRLLPLLDVIFLLLIFFLLLPQGTETSESRQVRHLSQRLEQEQAQNELLRWRYGAEPADTVRLRTTTEVVIDGRELFFLDRPRERLAFEQMEERLKQGRSRKLFNFVTVYCGNGAYATTRQLQRFLEELQLPYLLDKRSVRTR